MKTLRYARMKRRERRIYSNLGFRLAREKKEQRDDEREERTEREREGGRNERENASKLEVAVKSEQASHTRRTATG